MNVSESMASHFLFEGLGLADCGHFSLSSDDVSSEALEESGLYALVGQALARSDHRVLHGGYLEKRTVYSNRPHFLQKGPLRDIHLGVDFWTAAGTWVVAPLDGILHSQANNSGSGNYGPTMILEHNLEGEVFYTLYGHLAKDSLARFLPGSPIPAGTRFARLGTESENGNWPPHLHFQVIKDLKGHRGDFPGVCAETDLEEFKAICPNPLSLFS